jgi:rhodanese-related sulfurtransferase
MSAVKQIDVGELERLKQAGPVLLLDVRTDAEVARGLIVGARHIPLHLLPSRYSELDPGAVTVIYCQSGGRSAQACAWLEDKGFERVFNLQGGVAAWMRDGLPLSAHG